MAASERAKTFQRRIISSLSWITTDDETETSPDIRSAKQLKLEDLKPLQEANRFCPYTCSDQQLKNFSEGFVPDNTKANTEWAVRVFNEWAAWRRTARADDAVPRDILFSCDAVALNKWLSLFIVKARKKDRSRCPSKTLTLLLCGLKRYMTKVNPCVPNFVDEKDPRFAGLRGTRDTVACQLREEGVGAAVKHTEVISSMEESLLWSQGSLGVTSPTALLNAVFFMNGKILCLRGGREHKTLKVSQFTFGVDEGGEYVVYTENGSKNRSGSYKIMVRTRW